MKAPLTHERLLQVLRYDAETGLFYRQLSSRKKPKVLGEWGGDDYLRVTVDGVAYLAHHLAWFYVNGAWPAYEIDHRNGAKYDNRIDNLRDVTHTVNMQNQHKPQKGCAVPLLGVSQAGSRFRASLSVAGKPKNLGLFDTAEAAHQAYLSAKRELHEGCTL